MADVGDPAVTLLVDDGLIGAAVLEVVVADQIDVAGAHCGDLCGGEKTAENNSGCEDTVAHGASRLSPVYLLPVRVPARNRDREEAAGSIALTGRSRSVC